MPTTLTKPSSLRDTHNTAFFRERARQDAREPQLNAWEAPLPPCPDGVPRKVWKRLFYASGSRLFVEVWWGKATESGVRVICNRVICCGYGRDECKLVVGEWLRTKDPDMRWLVFEFDRQHDLAVHYLESRGVLHRQRQQERERFFAAASSTANRLLLLLADNPGAKREALQSELGLTRDNLKKHLARLRALGLADQVRWRPLQADPGRRAACGPPVGVRRDHGRTNGYHDGVKNVFRFKFGKHQNSKP